MNENITTCANFAYTDAEFKGDSLTPGQYIKDGNPLPGIPEWQASFGVDAHHPWREDWELIGNASFQFTGDRFSDVTGSQNRHRDSQEIFNLRFRLENDRYAIIGFVNNVFNDVEAVALQQRASDSPALLLPASANPNRPRTIGVTLRKSF